MRIYLLFPPHKAKMKIAEEPVSTGIRLRRGLESESSDDQTKGNPAGRGGPLTSTPTWSKP